MHLNWLVHAPCIRKVTVLQNGRLLPTPLLHNVNREQDKFVG